MAAFRLRLTVSSLQKLLGKDINYLEMYNASEGFFAAQDNPVMMACFLFLDHGIFMEFMPVEEYGKPDPQTIGLKDVEFGKTLCTGD